MRALSLRTSQNRAWNITAAIQDPPYEDALARLAGFVDDEPRPDRKRPRRTIQVFPDATDAGKDRKIVQRLFNSTKHGLGAVDAAVHRDVIEEFRQVAFRIERPDDTRRHRDD
jgi:hypothetical protein